MTDRSSDPVARLRAAGCVFAEDEAAILRAEAASPARLDALVERRVAGEPLEYIVGWAAFCGRRIAVEPGVFVPRRRTELLVRRAVARGGPGATVVDLCCGSGAVAAAIAAALGGSVEVHATDIEPAAVRCAVHNLAECGGRVYLGDFDSPLPGRLLGRVDLLVANVPYVPTTELGLLPPEARMYEPRSALDGGGDGLDLVRRLAAAAPRWLAPGGAVLVETSVGQVASATEAMTADGLVTSVETDEDLGGTVVIGTRRRAGTAAPGAIG